jgi:drug/metabolite transporter (DMT)-like permease
MFAIGTLLTIHNFCLFAGNRNKLVAGPLVVLLEQATVPVTMIVSYLFIGSRFTKMHLAGAALVIAGMVLFPL